MAIQQLELTLQAAFTDGIAYFVDNSGAKYFRPRDGNPIRQLIDGTDNHPMMYQFSQRNPLTEEGRKFASLGEADHYVSALTDFDRMIRLVDIATTDTKLSEGLRREASECIAEEQERIKREHLDVLDTIPGFAKVKKYLDMSPEQIYDELKTQGTPKDSTV